MYAPGSMLLVSAPVMLIDSAKQPGRYGVCVARLFGWTEENHTSDVV